ncbi:hypothetical protein K2X33_13885 [bacterium]|nr:hypothetical protein [bacterium]
MQWSYLVFFLGSLVAQAAPVPAERLQPKLDALKQSIADVVREINEAETPPTQSEFGRVCVLLGRAEADVSALAKQAIAEGLDAKQRETLALSVALPLWNGGVHSLSSYCGYAESSSPAYPQFGPSAKLADGPSLIKALEGVKKFATEKIAEITSAAPAAQNP